MKKGVLFTLLPVIFVFSLNAQRGWEVGGWAGISYYFGDLNTNYDLSTPGIAGGAIFRYNFNERLSLKFSGNYGQVSADDARSSNLFEKARNLSFQSDIIELATQFEFNFLPYIHGSEEHFFTPYLSLGMNIFRFNPKTDFNGRLVELRPLGTEGQFKGEEYFTVQAGLAYAVGLKFDLNEVWSINIELGGRSLFTDYLDDVSTVYPDKSDLLQLRGEDAVALSDRSITIDGVDSNIGEPGRQRGNKNNNDSYVFLGVGLVYYFGDLRCPEYGR